jgi:hypothetical protein
VGPEGASGGVGRRFGGRRFGGRRNVFVAVGMWEENGSRCGCQCGGDAGVVDRREIP